MKKLIQKEKDDAEISERLNVLVGLGHRLGGTYL